MSGLHARVPSAAGYHRLLRVRADGQCEYVTIDRAVRAVDATPESLVISVDDDPGRVGHLGADTYNVGWTRRYLSIPWGAELPDRISVAESATSDQLPPGIRKQPNMSWYDDSETGGRGLYPAAGVWWQLGRDRKSRAAFEVLFARVLGSAQDASGRIVRRYALGPGMVVSIGAIDGDRALGVAIRRPGETGLVDVLTLRPGSSEVTTLLAGDAVDITESCWPLVPRPIEVSSYEAEVLASNSSLEHYWHGTDGTGPLAREVTQVLTRLEGQWPDTRLEWTFLWTDRPGVRLRRRVRLYDQLGRITKPEHALTHIMEYQETNWVPPASAARDGILDF